MSQLRRNALALLALVIVAIGVVFLVRAYQINNPGEPSNQALVDSAATEEASVQIARALTEVFSFDHADPARALAAADNHLMGDAREEYDVLMSTLQKEAPGQELVLSAQVQVAAVRELTDDKARLLVFLDQHSERKGDEEKTVSAAQLKVDAERVGGAWRVVGFETL